MKAQRRSGAGGGPGGQRGRRRGGRGGSVPADRRGRPALDSPPTGFGAGSEQPEKKDVERVVPGVHPVRELLRAHLAGPQPTTTPRALWVSSDRRTSAVLKEIVALATEAGVRVYECSRSQLDVLAAEVSHQGVVAIASPYHYLGLDELLGAVPPEEPALFVALDGVTDPQNLGSVARTAEAVGAHGLILPARRSAGVGPAAEKAAAGAFSHVRVARVPNLASALRELARRRLWTVGLAASGEVSVQDCELLGEAVTIVVGAEGRGLSRLVAERCDVLASIEMLGQVASLNASVAAAVTLYEALRRRRSSCRRTATANRTTD